MSDAWWARHQRWLLRLVVLIVIACVFGPSMMGHFRHSLSLEAFNDDALQQIWPFYRYQNPELFQNDYIADYYLDCMPQGYKALMIALAQFGDLRVLSKCMVYPLFVILLVVMARNGRNLAGEIGMWMSIIGVLGFGIYLSRMAGGLPRSFALPLFALLLMCLLEKRPLLLAVTTVFASLFYPVASVMGGILLVSWLLALDTRNRDLPKAWRHPGKRIALIGVTGLLCLACVLPTLIQASKYGSKISSRTVADFPELKMGGRYNPVDSYPFDSPSRALIRNTLSMARPHGNAWPVVENWANARFIHEQVNVRLALFWGLCVAGVLICAWQMWRNPLFCRFMLFAFVGLMLFIISRQVYPLLYMPGRYAEYTFFVVFLLLLPLLPVTLGTWLTEHTSNRRLGKVISVLLCVLAVMFLTRRGDAKAGYLTIKNLQNPIFKELSALDAEAYLAGWFGYPLQLVPYLYQRPVLVSYELHQLFHQDYALKMRRRTVAVIDAYYPQALADVLNLRDTTRTSHLLISRSHLQSCPGYFKPYDRYLKQRFSSSIMPELLEGVLQPAIIYSDEHFILLDLRLIPQLSTPQ